MPISPCNTTTATNQRKRNLIELLFGNRLNKKKIPYNYSFPTNNATDTTSIQNVFCAVKAKRKYKKKPQADSELGMVYFFVKMEKQEYFDHL